MADSRTVDGYEGGAADLVAVAIDERQRELAHREAVVEAGDPEAVGEVIDAYADGDRVVTVRFAAQVEGYRGWQWSVTLALLDPAAPTVSEVVLLPGPAALVAPPWVPWGERVRAGDLGVGDLLPSPPDDERLVPAYLQSDDPAVEEVAHELGVGRVRVLSRRGRTEAAERWFGGDFGPGSEMAKHAPATCATCAFFVPLAGSLGARFGVCTNEFSPADGRVVDVEFGCGAHSEAVVDRSAASATSDAVVDELLLDVFRHGGDDGAAVPLTDESGEVDAAGGSDPAEGTRPPGEAGL